MTPARADQILDGGRGGVCGMIPPSHPLPPWTVVDQQGLDQIGLMKEQLCYQLLICRVVKNPPALELLKGATKLYFTHYLCVIIILFNTGLYKYAFFTDSFGKGFLFFFAFCIVSSSMYPSQTLQHLHNHCLYSKWVSVTLCVCSHLFLKIAS